MATSDEKPAGRKRPIKRILLGVAALFVLLLAGGIAVLATIDLKPILQKQVSKSLERTVAIGSIDVKWGIPLKLEIRDLHIANATWGSTPDMVSIDRISAEIDTRALLSGQLVYHNLALSKPIIVLERDPQGIGNWRFGTGTSGPSSGGLGGLAVVPKNRGQFPTLLNFTLQEGKISYRTFSGHVLVIDLDQVAIHSPSAEEPVKIDAAGAYNGQKIDFAIVAHSFDELRNRDLPFAMSVALSRQSASVHFDGTMMEPLDIEGVKGTIKVDAKKVNDLLSIFHTELAANPDITLNADLTRQGDHWTFINAKGQLASNQFAGQLTLDEGARGQPDDVDTTLSFGQLLLDKVLTSSGKDQKKSKGGDAASWMTAALPVPDKSAPRLKIKVTADQVKYQTTLLNDVALAVQMAPGSLTVAPSQVTFLGMKLHLNGSLKAADSSNLLALDVVLDDGDIAPLVKAAGATPQDLSGRIGGAVTLKMRGANLQEGLKTGDGGAVLSMTKGRISRDLIEKATTDLRSVFRKQGGTTEISCLLAVIRLKNGLATLSQLRLRTPDATLNGSGQINLQRQSLNLALQSDARSTGFLALDLPVKITGDWHDPKFGLGDKSVKPLPSLQAIDISAPALQKIAATSTCR